jgi:L-lysine exporter family protein LysE/ArgO
MLLGFGAAIPIGPINLLIIHQALHSYWRAVAIGLGAMSADIAYLLLLLSGVQWLVEPEWLRPASLAGAVLLSWFAFRVWRSDPLSLTEPVGQVAGRLDLLPWLKGLLLTASNPYTILFWASVSLAVPAGGEPMQLLLGLVLAILAWVFLLPAIVHQSRHLLTPRLASRLSLFAALLLALFAARLFVQALWPEDSVPWNHFSQASRSLSGLL